MLVFKCTVLRFIQSVWGLTNGGSAEGFLSILYKISCRRKLSVVKPRLSHRSLFPVLFCVPIFVVIVVLDSCIDLRLGVMLLEEWKSSLFSIRIEFILRHERFIWLINCRQNIVVILISMNSVISKILIIFEIFCLKIRSSWCCVWWKIISCTKSCCGSI